MRIEVTQTDIDKGEPGDCLRCPVALAFQRVPKVIGDAVVTDGEIELVLEDKPDVYTEFPSPCEVSDFIRAFDKGQPVTPFAFDLDL